MRAVDATAAEQSSGGQVVERPEIRDAATVILVADRPDLHALMLERTSRAGFGPRGAVDAADRRSRVQAGVVDLDDAAASAEHGLDAGGLGFRVAAVRECFEEAGILLARDLAGRPLDHDPRPPTGRPVDHDPGLATARDRLNAGAASFVDLLEARSLVIAGAELRLFSH